MADEKRPKNWWLRTVIAAFLTPPVYIIAGRVLFEATIYAEYEGEGLPLWFPASCIVGLMWMVVFTFPWWQPLGAKK